MNIDINRIGDVFKGNFLAEPRVISKKLSRIKAFVFDWDGVFNNGIKDEGGSSAYNEIDAMGTNLLRLNHYLRTSEVPLVGIISGQQNKAAFELAKREHFNVIYYGALYKVDALMHFCNEHSLETYEVAYFFDDVLDLSVAQICGLRIMISRRCNPFLLEFVGENNLAEYLTAADGGNHAVREAVELLTGISGMYEETIEHRMQFSEIYQAYLKIRNVPQPVFYSVSANNKIERVTV